MLQVFLKSEAISLKYSLALDHKNQNWMADTSEYNASISVIASIIPTFFSTPEEKNA